jgi:hypothetical protein
MNDPQPPKGCLIIYYLKEMMEEIKNSIKDIINIITDKVNKRINSPPWGI